jgi:intracellular sulfur oxidation DsrE/DsrF family protein
MTRAPGNTLLGVFRIDDPAGGVQHLDASRGRGPAAPRDHSPLEHAMTRITRRVLAAAMAAPLLMTMVGCATTDKVVGSKPMTADGRIPVVFHVTSGEPTYWNQALNNARNYQLAMGENKVFIEIVTNGPGIRMLTADSKVEPRVTAALSQGVKIVACEQTMKTAKLTKDDMILGIGFVPGGIVEVIDRQRDGWSYVHY